jgi:hypothetical protein
MKVAVFEVCRRPEVPKANSEAKILHDCFLQLGINFDLYTNDGFLGDYPKTGENIDREIIAAALSDPQIDVVHFAVHGQPGVGLVLKWSGPIGQREVANTLTGAEIRQMSISQNKLVVSGACESSSLAQDFIFAGAKAYVSPRFEIPWAYLVLMFQTFYAALQSGATTEAALAQAVANYPELASYEVHSSAKK